MASSLIPILFHPLKRINRLVRKVRLSDFWLSIWRKYGYGVLEQRQVEWIIMAKGKGWRNLDIANSQGISIRRVQQLYSAYRKDGRIPVLKKPGRPRSPVITDHERSIVRSAYGEFRVCACYLEYVLPYYVLPYYVLPYLYGIKIDHRRIHGMLKEEGRRERADRGSRGGVSGFATRGSTRIRYGTRTGTR